MDYYLPAQARGIELRIFDGEHQLVRHVSSETASATKHPSLSIAEHWFPEPQRLETSAGMHRFIWNLARGTSGVTESDEPADGEGDIPRGPRVLRVLERQRQERGLPERIVIDHGTEFTSKALDQWAYEHRVTLHFITPGRPMENPYVAYCTSLDGCGKMWVEAARSWSLMPCCFRGGSSSGS
jgi:hypothetical protein